MSAARPLLVELGFDATFLQLTSEHRELLALPESIDDVNIASGTGALRALLFGIPALVDPRDAITRIAGRLSTHAPQLYFILIGVQAQSGTLTIAAFDSARPRPRVVALLVDRERIVDSDCETVCALAAARGTADVLTHGRWLDILGRESIGRRFFRELERVVGSLAGSLDPQLKAADAAELALLYVSRLIFLSFIETKGWLDGDHAFLGNRFADCMMTGGGYHRRVLNPLFFGTLNTSPPQRASRARQFGRVPFLNGGLFSRTPLERRASDTLFSDEAMGEVFGDLLTRYRFTAREDGRSWSEAAIDPEMLGRAFECLMSGSERKGTGAYYTPHALVRQVSRSALCYGLSSENLSRETIQSALDGAVIECCSRADLLDATARLRILDPACGSGAFLVHLLEELCTLRIRLGDLRTSHAVRREVLTRSIFGVDVNPMAVWLCELRLWLAIAIEDPEPDPMRVVPLPNLDRHIRIGDSLSGDGFVEGLRYRQSSRVTVLRSRYARATGPRKRSLGKALDSIERDCAIALLERRVFRLSAERRELLMMLRSPDLFGKRRYPTGESRDLLGRLRRDLTSSRRELRRVRNGGGMAFSFSSGFADASAEGGFRIIVGNPPWVRTHNLDPLRRDTFRERYAVYRNAAWAAGADAAHAGKGFASQVDASALFVERSASLLQPGGTLSLIVPAKLWRSLAGGGVRNLLQTSLELRELHDLTSAPQSFDAAVYPSVITASRARNGHQPELLTVVSHRRDGVRKWVGSSTSIAFDATPGSPWLIVPPDVRAAFDRLRARGIPISRTSLGRPLLGVKTGCNNAFLVSNSHGLEPHVLRRAVRGDDITKWKLGGTSDRIIWTHDDSGPLRVLPPRVARHLSGWRHELESRTDSRAEERWWRLFRTEGAESKHARVVWSDIGKAPRAAILPAGDASVPLNTCYVIKCSDHSDAAALAAILNCRLLGAWLGALAEPARGGYSRFMGWTVALLPLPHDWLRARALLAPVARAAVAGNPPNDNELLESVLDAYMLTFDEVSALLQWST